MDLFNLEPLFKSNSKKKSGQQFLICKFRLGAIFCKALAVTFEFFFVYLAYLEVQSDKLSCCIHKLKKLVSTCSCQFCPNKVR